MSPEVLLPRYQPCYSDTTQVFTVVGAGGAVELTMKEGDWVSQRQYHTTKPLP